VSARQGQHLAADAPAVRIRQVHRQLKVRAEPLADRRKLVRLERGRTLVRDRRPGKSQGGPRRTRRDEGENRPGVGGQTRTDLAGGGCRDRPWVRRR
jgi:hypothetical protein